MSVRSCGLEEPTGPSRSGAGGLFWLKKSFYPLLNVCAAHRGRNSQIFKWIAKKMKPYVDEEWGKEQRSQQSLCASSASETSSWHRGPGSVRHAVRCAECLLLHEFGAPSSPPSVRSSLSRLIRSNLTTLHGRIRNQVTNRAPLLLYSHSSVYASTLSPCCSNVSHLFQDTCFQDNTRPL